MQIKLQLVQNKQYLRQNEHKIILTSYNKSNLIIGAITYEKSNKNGKYGEYSIN